MNTEYVSRLIKVSYPESEYPDDIIIASMPYHVTKAQMDAAIAKSAYIIRHFDDSYDTDQDLVRAILDNVQNYIRGFSWHYTDFFTGFDVNASLGARDIGG